MYKNLISTTNDSLTVNGLTSNMKNSHANMLKESSNDTCRLGHKGPFLFVEDMSYSYSSALENKVYYRCFCLECGKLDDYKMSREDRRLLIKIDDIDYSTCSIDDIRKEYFQLLSAGLSGEEAVSMLNKTSKTQKLKK